MTTKQEQARRSGATDSQRKKIWQKLKDLAEKLAVAESLPPEAVVLEMRYFHQSASNPYRTNASAKDKSSSLKYYKNKCKYPGCSVTNLSKVTAVFHHKKRAVVNQHGPQNLLPYCIACHDKEHGNKKASTHKGSKK